MVKEDVKAGLEAAVQEWGAGVTAGHGNTQTTITTSQGRTLDVKYVVQVEMSLFLKSVSMSEVVLLDTGRRLHEDPGHCCVDRVDEPV